MDKSVQEIYGNRTRTRVCGLCWKDGKILLINHKGLYGFDFWAPPGGGIEFGMAVADNLKREFQEETGLNVLVGPFKFLCEFINPPLHALELFFDVTMAAGKLSLGTDPEMGEKRQIISDVAFMSPMEIDRLPEKSRHGLFSLGKSAENLRELKGYYRI